MERPRRVDAAVVVGIKACEPRCAAGRRRRQSSYGATGPGSSRATPTSLKRCVRARPPLALLRRRDTRPERLRDLGQREALAHGYAGEAFGALSSCHTPSITVVAQTQDGLEPG